MTSRNKSRNRNGDPEEMEGGGATAPAAPHPAVAPLAFLLGKWRGEGEGSFPTISPFRYGEELLFSHHPSKVNDLLACICISLSLAKAFTFSRPCRTQPVISYTQRTWKAASGEPMHAESGYWRPRPDGSVEVVISQSTGLAEVQVSSYCQSSYYSKRGLMLRVYLAPAMLLENNRKLLCW